MTHAASTNTGYDRIAVAQQLVTASATVRAEVRSVVINATSNVTVTFPAPTGAGDQVYFVKNESTTSSAGIATLTAANAVTWDGTNQSITLYPGEAVVAVSSGTDQYTTYRVGSALEVLTADGAITIPKSRHGVCVLAKAGALAATLAAPTAVQDAGKMLCITAGTANAHTITVTAGFNGGGGTKDVATLGGALGDGLLLVAYGTNWHIVASTNATLG